MPEPTALPADAPDEGLVVRPDFLPADCIRTPFDVRPRRRVRGPGALLSRLLTARWAPPRAYAGRNSVHMPWAKLTPDEQWLLAVTRWVRLTTLVLKNPLADNIPRATLRRSRVCRPDGYRLSNRPRHRFQGWPYCKWRLCPYCYARAVEVQFKRLLAALKTCPDDRPVYAGFFAEVATDSTRVADRVREICPAGAVLARYPLPPAETGEPVDWVCRVVMLTDDRKRVTAPVLVKSAFTLADRLARWFRYPWQWAARPGHRSLSRAHTAVAALPAKARLFEPYGACRADYVPGKGLLDWSLVRPSSSKRAKT